MLKARVVIINLFLAVLLASLLAACGKSVAPPPDPAAAKNVKYGYPVERLKDSNACYEVLIEYPFLGRPPLDQQVRLWVDAQYYDSIEELASLCAQEQPRGRQRYVHKVEYKIYQAAGSISVLFESWTYAGGAHGQNGLQPINLLVQSGEELRLKDLFADSSDLYVFISDYVYQKLQPTLGDIWQGSPMFTEGLEPVEASFRNFVITPKGLVIFFPPYQIAPYSEGTQSCEVPLADLLRFRPKPGIWQ